MNSTESNEDNVDYLINRLGDVFANLDRRNGDDMTVVALDVSAIGKAQRLVALRRQIQRDAK